MLNLTSEATPKMGTTSPRSIFLPISLTIASFNWATHPRGGASYTHRSDLFPTSPLFLKCLPEGLSREPQLWPGCLPRMGGMEGCRVQPHTEQINTAEACSTFALKGCTFPLVAMFCSDLLTPVTGQNVKCGTSEEVCIHV